MKEIAALRIENEALKLHSAWAEASSSSLLQIGEKMMNDVIGADRVNTNTTLLGLPIPDQAVVKLLWTTFQNMNVELPETTDSEVHKFQPILEKLWKHCAPADLQVQGNKSAIDDNYWPDITVLPAYEARAEFRTLVTGCEGKRDLGAPDLRKEAFGQLSTYVARTRLRQPQRRPFIFFAICDLRHIAIVKCNLEVVPLTATRTDFLPLLAEHHLPTPPEGFTALVRLLHAGMANLGYSDSGLPSYTIKDQNIALTERIAKGGHSYVYTAQYQGHKVAVKISIKSDVTFDAEQNVLSKLGRHNVPMIPRPILFDEADPTKLVMSYCGVDRLADVATNETKTIVDWLQIGVKLTRVMEKVHVLGIVHRDIRPENITTTDGKEFFIVDWGLAGKNGDVLPHVVGVAAYQSSAYVQAMQAPEPRSYAFKAIDDLESIAYTIAEACAGMPRRRNISLANRTISFEQGAPKQLQDYVTAVRGGKSYGELCAILGSSSNEVLCGVTTTRGNPCTQLKGKCRFHEKKNK